MRKIIDGDVTISRTSKDEIRIQIKDETSRQTFATVLLTPYEFAMAVTGLSYMKCKIEVDGLENVGKQKVMENRSVLYTGSDTYNRAGMETWIDEHCQEEGWIIKSNLGSQSSIDYNSKNNTHTLNYSVYKYVEPV